ncbi:MAG: formylglycine-generating enzyme family protein, partial [Planctomycetes bacterium]|nr:formylglycine-generating enzyme family protein [Planctomycetota bacterium]
ARMRPFDEPAAAQPEIFGRFVVLDVVDDGMRPGDLPGRPSAPVTHRALDLDRALRPLVALQRVKTASLLRREVGAWDAASEWHEKLVDDQVAQWVGHGIVDDVRWRAREWIDGVSIDALLRRALVASAPNPLSTSFSLSVAYVLGTGLLDVGHRAPDNILVAMQPRSRRAFVTPQGRVLLPGPLVVRAVHADDALATPPHGDTVGERYEAACLAALAERLFSGRPVVEAAAVGAPGLLGRVPAELRRVLGQALGGDVSLRDLVLTLQGLMQAAGGGHYSTIAAGLQAHAGDLVDADARDSERLLALARRMRARRRPRGDSTVPAEVRPLPMRPRPAPQDGPLAASDHEPLDASAPDDMVVVPGGRYLFAAGDGEPAYVDVAPFLLDRRPVTCGDWAEFCRDTSTSPPSYWPQPLQWSPDPDNLTPEMRAAPVVEVSLDAAARYAAWKGKRLPTEIEWELAARGFDGRLWPWGHEFDAAKAGSGWQEPWAEREPSPLTAVDP